MRSATMPAEGRQPAAYAGEISAAQAWDRLQADPQAALIDVRTPAEWVFSGLPDLRSIGKKAHAVSWKIYPSYSINTQFVSTLETLCPDKAAALFFLCRTGGRSLDAAIAMTAQGYSRCYNITDGFDGPLDASRHRGNVAGWRASHLPWEQE